MRISEEAAKEAFEFYQHHGQQPFPNNDALKWCQEKHKQNEDRSNTNNGIPATAANNPREKVEDALKHIDPDIIRGKWVDVLMAIHSLDADWGLQVALSPTNRAPKYKGLDDLQTR